MLHDGGQAEMDVLADLWLLARLFSSMRLFMKSTASTLRAVAARCPVNRPMPAPSSRMRFSSTHPSIASTCPCTLKFATMAD